LMQCFCCADDRYVQIAMPFSETKYVRCHFHRIQCVPLQSFFGSVC
jgi:hypothetical protein